MGWRERQLAPCQYNCVGAGDKITNLFNFVKEIFRVPVQDELADRAKREFVMRPNFRNIECEVTVDAFRLVECHRLLN
jgi:hypothetical protein